MQRVYNMIVVAMDYVYVLISLTFSVMISVGIFLRLLLLCHAACPTGISNIIAFCPGFSGISWRTAASVFTYHIYRHTYM